jgi:xanthine permease XanP
MAASSALGVAWVSIRGNGRDLSDTGRYHSASRTRQRNDEREHLGDCLSWPLHRNSTPGFTARANWFGLSRSPGILRHLSCPIGSGGRGRRYASCLRVDVVRGSGGGASGSSPQPSPYLQLGVVGIGETLDVQHEKLPAFPLHLGVTTFTLLVCVVLSIWGRGTLKLLCTALGLIAGMAGAGVIGLIDPAKLAEIGHASWIALPHPAFFQLGFNAGLAPAFLAAGVAATLRAVGVITTCQRINNAAWRQPDRKNIRKGVLADGLSNVVSGVLGAPGMSIAPSLVAVSGATGATSRIIGFASSILLLIFAFSPKLCELFLLLPPEVAGSLLVFTSSFMISGGMQVILSRPVDTRAVYVIGISTLLALSINVYPKYFQDLPPAVQSFANSPLVLCLIAAFGLSLLFRIGTRQFGQVDWNDSEESISSAINFLRAKANDWKIGASLVETSADHAREVIAYVVTHHLRHHEGTLHASSNGRELQLDIVYEGTRTVHLPVARAAEAPMENDIEDEEAAAYVGLRNFIRGLAVDSQKVAVQKDRVKVRLTYAI